jgi:hypothetical protein
MTDVALCLFGLGLLLFTRQFVSEADHFTIGFSGCSGWSVWLYVASIIVVLTQPRSRYTLSIIVVVAVAMQLITLFADPFLSTDMYRYVWDGIVQHAHINPYRYVPGDPALLFLRAPHQEIYDNINRRDYAHTIYPPIAQMIFWLVTWIAPTVIAIKAAMIVFEAITGAALAAILRHVNRPREELLLYAWCPLLAWEFGGNGHIDAAVFCFVVLALLFRLREQLGWSALFFALAVMTKFYPLVLLPALYKRRDWKLPTMLAGVGVGCYLPYLSVGSGVFGFLSGYNKEEGIDSGARFFLLDQTRRLPGLTHLPNTLYFAFCAVVLGGIALWAWRHAAVEGGRTASPTSAVLRSAAWLGFAMMLLFSPHYPWYIAWLIPLFALAPSLPLFVYICGFFYLFTTALAAPGPKMFLLNQILYSSVAFVALLSATVFRRWPLRSLFRVETCTAEVEQ